MRRLPRGRPGMPPAGLALVAALLVAACNGPVLANPPAVAPGAPPTPAPTVGPSDPRPVVLPRDDAPHDRLTEWWYYTGHLRDGGGSRWGFEFVIFRAERGELAVSWASHVALTDETGRAFHYAQRSEIGAQVDLSGATTSPGFALALRGADPADPTTFARAPWAMAGADGRDRLTATAEPGEALGDPSGGFALDLELAATRPVALHDDDGWVDFGPAGGSYYYSRTSMRASGTIGVGDRTLEVDGSAWFDHQWGDFIAVGGGGWDWFAINLDDGTDITLSLVRAADGTYPLVYGTLVEADGTTRRLGRDAFQVAVESGWTSPTTGATYPAGWRVTLPAEGLDIHLSPTVPQQELDTRATTGVVYWEGSQRVSASRDGRPIGGEAYVELTGYAGLR